MFFLLFAGCTSKNISIESLVSGNLLKTKNEIKQLSRYWGKPKEEILSVASETKIIYNPLSCTAEYYFDSEDTFTGIIMSCGLPADDFEAETLINAIYLDAKTIYGQPMDYYMVEKQVSATDIKSVLSSTFGTFLTKECWNIDRHSHVELQFYKSGTKREMRLLIEKGLFPKG